MKLKRILKRGLINSLLDYLFMLLLRRELRQMDQWLRWKMVDGDMNYFIDLSLRDDGYNYDEIKI